jgi:hypothetical protein
MKMANPKSALLALVVVIGSLILWGLLDTRQSARLGSPDNREPMRHDITEGNTTTEKTIELSPETSERDVRFDTFQSNVSEEIQEEADRTLEQTLFDSKYSDPREFFKLQWISGIRYKEVRRLIKKESIPTLCDMLRDQQYVSDWANVAKVICLVAEDANSLPELVRYIQQAEDWTSTTKPYRMIGKVKTLVWIGLIGGEQVDRLLRNALTAEGSVELAKDWIDGPLPSGYNTHRDEAVGLIRGSAAIGIMLSQNAESAKLVEQLYMQVHDDCRKDRRVSELYYQLIDAMVVRDFLVEKGKEQYLNLIGTNHNEFDPYLKKYAWFLAEKTSSEKTY